MPSSLSASLSCNALFFTVSLCLFLCRVLIIHQQHTYFTEFCDTLVTRCTCKLQECLHGCWGKPPQGRSAGSPPSSHTSEGLMRLQIQQAERKRREGGVVYKETEIDGTFLSPERIRLFFFTTNTSAMCHLHKIIWIHPLSVLQNGI